jgi:hypothetical protein
MSELLLQDLEAMHQHYGIAQGEQVPGADRRTDDLLEDLGQVGVLEEVGIGLERWARLRGVPMEYAEALRGGSSTRGRARGKPRRACSSRPPS